MPQKLLVLFSFLLLGYSAQSQTCNADFLFNSGNCPAVSFVDNSTSSPGNIISWNWDFGDGNVSTLQNPTHTYSANGLYIACLTTISTDSCINTYCDSISIGCIQSVQCQAFMQYTLGACPNILFFDASTASPGNVISWNWDFGDGSTSTSQNPAHTYTANGTYTTCLTIITSDSCINTYCDSVPVNCIAGNPTCNADFLYNSGNCPAVSFVDQSTGSPGSVTEWDWDFGDGNTSTMQSPTHTYSANGTYLTCLTITTTDSCVTTYCDTIVINCIGGNPTCNADFQYTLGGCPSVSFFDASASSPGTPTWWSWDFGDGTSSNAQNPTHTYAADGVYPVCLTMWTTDSCVSTFCDQIIINCIGGNPTCNADFIFNSGNCPAVDFIDNSTSSPGNIINWNWDFGDGNVSTIPNPSHTYSANGLYIACLTITTADSCVSTWCDSVNINCIGGNPTCNAAFQYTLGACPTIMFFDASASSPGTPTWWSWDFGDGTSSNAQNPTHTYAANGVYPVCLTMWTTDSCVSTFCDQIIINCIGGNPSCNADFIFNSGNCPAVDFIDNSTSSPGNIINWNWDFGDGNVSTIPNPSHTYSANGLYIACLTITTADSCVSTWCDSVNINCIGGNPTCNAAFQYTLGACPTIMFFDASASSPGTPTWWSWDFGDGTSSNAQNPTHTYAANGVYPVCLTMWTTDSCVSTFCDQIIINCIGGNPTCNADFIYNSGNCPAVSFVDQSTGSPGAVTEWDWDFGDGNTSTMQNPTHTYSANGTYIACVTITTTDSCVTTFCDSIVINCIGGCPAPTADFWVDLNFLVADFTDLSTSSTGVLNWHWDFGDGNTSSLQNPTHTYLSNGMYIACLTVTDSCGTDTLCNYVEVGVGIGEESLGNMDVTAYPNPGALFNIAIDNESNGDFTYEVVDLQGRVITAGNWDLPAGESIQTIDLNDQADGLYFLRITDGNRFANIQLVRMR